MSKSTTIAVGDRIASDGCYATVRYVGHLSVDSQSASSKIKDTIWIGVEWDDPSRGKHDGSYAGAKYFTTSKPTSGSFLRPEKCITGVDFMTALASRYGGQSTNGVADEAVQDMYVCGRNQQTAVTAIGLEQVMQKQSCFSQLCAVSLRGMYVRSAGKPGDIAPNAVHVEELDISLNLMTNWYEVMAIVSQMPLLKSLNVSENRLALPEFSTNNNITAVSSVSTLYVNRMEYNWTEVSHCVAMFSSIKLLHACYNNISHIDNIPASLFHTISLINLEGNPISDWTGILALGSLPQLTTLIANDCGLTSIRFPGCRCVPSDCFPLLSSLSISGNQIADWSSFDELNRLQLLTSLRFVRNPLSTATGISATRHVIIAKIARLKNYNGAVITLNERQGAEIDYLRAFGKDWKAAGGSLSSDTTCGPTKEFLNEHPRYEELIKIYGEPEDGEMELAKSSALKNNLVNVRIVTSHDHPALTRKLPVKMTVQKLKALIRRSYHINDPSRLRLVYIQPVIGSAGESTVQNGADSVHAAGNVAHVELDNDLRELSFYSIENDAVVHAEW
jgi:hypothetical protein